MTTLNTTHSMFGLAGTPSAGSMLKSLGVHVFMLGLLIVLPTRALLREAPMEKDLELDIVFHREPEVAIAAPVQPAITVPAAKTAAARVTVAPAPSPRPAPNAADRPVPAKPGNPPVVESQPQPVVAKTGILAFKDQFANVAQNQASPRLGTDARYVAGSAAPVSGSQASSGSMLSANSAGSSGGINAASLNRSVSGGGAGGNGDMPGVPVGRATSTIAAIPVGERPKPQSQQPAASRTDEEIQIVFDRYKASFYRLYSRALRNDPTLKGQIVLSLTIEPDGTVSMCKLQSATMKAPELADQVINITRTINFGAKGGTAVTIVYPIDFLPAA